MRELERFIAFIVGDREEMMFRNKEVVLDAKPIIVVIVMLKIKVVLQWNN
ncbi:hypothetical protein ABET51_03770 [Metabacillus fastidiosus]